MLHHTFYSFDLSYCITLLTQLSSHTASPFLLIWPLKPHHTSDTVDLSYWITFWHILPLILHNAFDTFDLSCCITLLTQLTSYCNILFTHLTSHTASQVEYIDNTEPDCIITSVKLKREEKDVFSLPKRGLEEIREAQREEHEAEEEEEMEEEEVTEEEGQSCLIW